MSDATECDHKGKGLAVMSWGPCCKGCGEPYPFESQDPHPDVEQMSHEKLVRLVELTASYCHGSPEYWNDKDAAVLIEMASRMAPCTEAAGANLYKLRSPSEPHQEHRKANDA